MVSPPDGRKRTKSAGVELYENVDRLAFRLELKKDKTGTERIIRNGMENGKPIVFDTDPCTGFWRRFGVGFMGLLPIESQL
jgi:hypothetical protein